MHIKPLAGMLAGLALLAAACGDDAETAANTQPPVETTAPATTAPATTAPATTATEPAGEFASRIISLSPTATEMVYAIGAGDQVIGIDDFSNYPPEAASKMQGLDGFNPNVEAIAALEPDLVLTDGTNPDFLGQLDSLGIAHWEGPAAVQFEDIYAQIEQLGAATGKIGEAAELVGGMQADIDAAIAALPVVDEPLTYYHELSSDYFSATSETFIGLVYSQLGLVNIADEADADTAYPQLSAEFIVSADPDLIFLACTKYCGDSPETVAARDGWADLAAVRNGNVIGLDDDVASRWGPRIVEFIQQVGTAVSAAAVPVG
jgi:iron complex transport system substrate-binding protein